MATISGDDYTTVMNEFTDLKEKLKQASGESEFLTAHYKRMFRAVRLSYEQAMKATITLDRKDINKEVKENLTALKERKQRDRDA